MDTLAKPVADDNSKQYRYQQAYQPSMIVLKSIYSSFHALELGFHTLEPGAHFSYYFAPPFLFVIDVSLKERYAFFIRCYFFNSPF